MIDPDQARAAAKIMTLGFMDEWRYKVKELSGFVVEDKYAEAAMIAAQLQRYAKDLVSGLCGAATVVQGQEYLETFIKVNETFLPPNEE